MFCLVGGAMRLLSVLLPRLRNSDTPVQLHVSTPTMMLDEAEKLAKRPVRRPDGSQLLVFWSAKPADSPPPNAAPFVQRPSVRESLKALRETAYSIGRIDEDPPVAPKPIPVNFEDLPA